jgi:hypothetical protein
MALYQDRNSVRYTSIRNVFDQIYTHPQQALTEGIYQCTICGDEIVAKNGEPVPDQGHHRHHAPDQYDKMISWRLLVMIQASNPRA